MGKISKDKPTFVVPVQKHKTVKRKSTPYHSKIIKKGPTLMKTVLFSTENNIDGPSSSKKVKFSQQESSTKKRLQRKATPYRLTNPCNDTLNREALKTVLFPMTNSDSDSDVEMNKFDVSFQFVSPLPSRSDLQESAPEESNSSLEVSHNGALKCSPKMELSAFQCSDSDFTFNTSSFLSDDSSSTISEELDVSLSNTKGEDSIIYDDMNLVVNKGSESELLVEESPQDEVFLNGEIELVQENGACLLNELNEMDTSEQSPTVDDYSEGDSVSEPEMFSDSEGSVEDNLSNTINEYSTLKVGTKSSSEVSKEASFSTFTIENTNFVVLLSNSKTYLHGLVSVTVLHGSVDILGYTLTSASGSQNIYSPKASPFLFFETGPSKENEFDDTLINFLRKLRKTEDLISHLPVKSTNCCIMVLKKLEPVEVNFMEKHIPQDLFPPVSQNASRYELLKTNIPWNCLHADPEWDLLAYSMTSSDRLLIAGGKGVGKSTMCRYMMNKLLMRYPKVMLIDLDPGQPEFTLSGCVSVSVIEKPVFGPNYTHLKTPLRCVFVSKINIFNSPHEYIRSVAKLLDTNLPSMPTLINYMGFTRDLGLELLSAIIAYSKPTSVVYIRSTSNLRNFKDSLDYEVIVEKAKLFASSENFPQFGIATICSKADQNEGWNLLPREIREISVLTYLGTMISKESLSLINCDKFTYIIDLNSITILHNNEEVTPEVINGNLVALCSKDEICYGWGVVRGVDSAENDLYIQTPLSLEEFEKVEVLILGSVTLPASLYMASTNKSIPNPYVCLNNTEDGDLMSKIPKRTHISVKQKLNKP